MPLKITVQDISSQKLVRHAADRPRGLLCALDEMASGGRRSATLEAGRPQRPDRWPTSRAGTRWTGWARAPLADNYAVAFFGNLQPRVLRENFKALSKDGLVQRFIPVNIRPEMRKLGHPVPGVLRPTAPSTIRPSGCALACPR